MKTSKDYAKRQLYRKFEIPRQIIKLITTNKILNIDIKNKYGRYFHNWPYSSTRTRNSCIITNRMRGNIAIYKINRTKFKTLINAGLICGIRKASW